MWRFESLQNDFPSSVRAKVVNAMADLIPDTVRSKIQVEDDFVRIL